MSTITRSKVLNAARAINQAWLKWNEQDDPKVPFNGVMEKANPGTHCDPKTRVEPALAIDATEGEQQRTKRVCRTCLFFDDGKTVPKPLRDRSRKWFDSSHRPHRSPAFMARPSKTC